VNNSDIPGSIISFPGTSGEAVGHIILSLSTSDVLRLRINGTTDFIDSGVTASITIMRIA
jgi:hypothetical protein